MEEYYWKMQKISKSNIHEIKKFKQGLRHKKMNINVKR